jgi:hypothetical protein
MWAHVNGSCKRHVLSPIPVCMPRFHRFELQALKDLQCNAIPLLTVQIKLTWCSKASHQLALGLYFRTANAHTVLDRSCDLQEGKFCRESLRGCVCVCVRVCA